MSFVLGRAVSVGMSVFAFGCILLIWQRLIHCCREGQLVTLKKGHMILNVQHTHNKM